MKRLTVKDYGSVKYKNLTKAGDEVCNPIEIKKCKFELCKEVCVRVNGCLECPINEVICRLSAYEDTGLMPEQIHELDELYHKKCEELAECKKRLPRCKLGETIYWLDKENGKVVPSKVFEIHHQSDVFTYYSETYGFSDEDWGKDVFLEEAEATTALHITIRESTVESREETYGKAD